MTVTEQKSGKPISRGELSFDHVVPALYIPKPPEPITARLNEQGQAVVRFPAVMGHVTVNRRGVMLEGSDIRRGGEFDLSPPQDLSSAESYILKITKSQQVGVGDLIQR